LIAAEMMSESPMITEPIMMPRAVFWSSSISLRSEKGRTALMMRKLTPKSTSPMAENTRLATI
jgi:hypothetical protein